jgi:hypothetical protein
MKKKNNDKYNLKRIGNESDQTERVKQNNSNNFDSRSKRNKVKKIETKRDSENRNTQLLALNKKMLRFSSPSVHLGLN